MQSGFTRVIEPIEEAGRPDVTRLRVSCYAGDRRL